MEAGLFLATLGFLHLTGYGAAATRSLLTIEPDTDPYVFPIGQLLRADFAPALPASLKSLWHSTSLAKRPPRLPSQENPMGSYHRGGTFAETAGPTSIRRRTGLLTPEGGVDPGRRPPLHIPAYQRGSGNTAPEGSYCPCETGFRPTRASGLRFPPTWGCRPFGRPEIVPAHARNGATARGCGPSTSPTGDTTNPGHGRDFPAPLQRSGGLTPGPEMRRAILSSEESDRLPICPTVNPIHRIG